jgi:hypothetical protein
MLTLLDRDTDPPPCVPPIETMAQFYEFVVKDIARLQFYKVSTARYMEGRFYAELHATEAGWIWNLCEIQEATP